MSFMSEKRAKLYLEIHDEMVKAAEELFKVYTKALPDRQNWLGQWGWRGNVGSISFDETEIVYEYEYSSHGETDYFRLELPISALYTDSFIHDEQTEWEEQKRLLALAKSQKEAKELEERSKAEYQRFLELKRKYESINVNDQDPSHY